ncbi:MAG: NADH-quinone oxidoreductase subunit J [Verrucomicrobiota bacterium]
MPPTLFYLFAAISLLGGIGVVVNRNPVVCAFSMVISFIGLAALFISLNAYFIGIVQILVYAGAIMVLFLFIIMLLDIKYEKERKYNLLGIAGGVIVVVFFFIQFASVLNKFEEGKEPIPAMAQVTNDAGEKVSDVTQLGLTIFRDFNYPLQVVAVLLLVATIGVVVLSRREVR